MFCIPLKSCIWAPRGLYWPEQCLQSQLKCSDCSQGPQKSGSMIFRKKTPFFLKFIGPVTPPWVLYPSEIMHIGSKELLIARAVFAKSINVIGWQAGAPKSREHDFPKKKTSFFLKFIGLVTPLWVLYPSEVMHMGSTRNLLATAVFVKSIKVLGLQPGAPKIREHDFPKKIQIF